LNNKNAKNVSNVEDTENTYAKELASVKQENNDVIYFLKPNNIMVFFLTKTFKLIIISYL
jgi:hypothetical protein